MFHLHFCKHTQPNAYSASQFSFFASTLFSWCFYYSSLGTFIDARVLPLCHLSTRRETGNPPGSRDSLRRRLVSRFVSRPLQNTFSFGGVLQKKFRLHPSEMNLPQKVSRSLRVISICNFSVQSSILQRKNKDIESCT